jgi:bifunctional enzyme CysN/CysC
MTTSSNPAVGTIEETRDFLKRHQSKEMLRFMTCGSVDDGKSTLIGRLLIETGAVYDDQLAALRSDSEKHGTTDDAVDPALLLDGLEDERQQGITIDVAYRYFHTPKRKFIIADSPGHEQYTRNMATAASTASLAIILVDARKGLLTQTRRHSFVVSLLGVRHVVLAVNKMDLVNYDQAVFDKICQEYREFAAGLEIPDIHFVPISALRGDNVVSRSEHMPWYAGAPLLHVLETVYVGSEAITRYLRFPIQRVVRPNADFRGYSGTLASGTVRVGDQIMVLPGRKSSRIQSIITVDGQAEAADAGDAITVTLEDEIDIARGDMLAHGDHLPNVSRHFEAKLVWMSEQPLAPGKSYWLKHTTRRTAAEIDAVHFRTDVNSLAQIECASLKLNEIGQCHITAHDPLAFDDYRQNRRTGSFILVDRVNHETVAAGLIMAPSSESPQGDHWDSEFRSKRLQLTRSRVDMADRHQRFGHPPSTILVTGLSGSGKTTIAYALEERLFSEGRAVMVLDGQNLRQGISRDLGFSAEERSENLRRAAEIARLVNDAGMICIAAFVAPDGEIRRKARQVIGEDRLLHIHLEASVHVCRQRDTSGRYVAADRGEIVNFPGVTVPYERPTDADLIIDTERASIEQCVDAIYQKLQQG